MKILFIGTVNFSLHMLTALLDKNFDIVAVVTAKNTGINSDYADLSPLCEFCSIPVLITTDINSKETIDWIKKFKPDLILCLGWSRLIKKELLQLPSLGIIGYHPSALPKNRGRHPLIWALVLGLKNTASTFFFMDENVDNGDTLSQQEIIISDDDDAETLYTKMIDTAKKQLLELIPLMINGEYKRVPQDHLDANVWRKREKQDGKIDWRMDAVLIYNLIRGLTHPYIGAYFLYNDREYKVWKSRVMTCVRMGNIEPGKVIKVKNSTNILVKCGDACIELLDIEPPLEVKKGDYL